MTYLDRLTVFEKRNRKIKRLYDSGKWTQAALSRQYGISRERIRQILLQPNGAKP